MTEHEAQQAHAALTFIRNAAALILCALATVAIAYHAAGVVDFSGLPKGH